MQDEPTVYPSQPGACPNCKLPSKPNVPFCKRCKFDLRHGKVKVSKHGRCIFCDKNRKLSREHIFPDWLRTVYAPHYSSRVHTLSRPELYKIGSPLHAQHYKEKNDVYHTVVRNVCESCNNNWMSNLQDAAKPIVKKLADGHWDNLNDTESNILTRWCIMLAINFECCGRQLITKPYQRTALMEGKVPSGWKVFIGSMKNIKCSGSSFTRINSVPYIQEADMTPLKVVSTYFCIELAAFCTFSAAGDQMFELAKYGGIDCTHVPMRQIFPDNMPAESLGLELEKSDLDGIQLRFGPITKQDLS